MRGYFGIGVENISKEHNVGALARSAHAFGANFFFSLEPSVDIHLMRKTDTSGSFDHMPYFQYDSLSEMNLPEGCRLVGVELTEDSIELPSFRHPTRAAYILGPEMGSLSPVVMERCEFTIKIPMKFCVNVSVAGALVMYDRLINMNRFPSRPVKAGGPSSDDVLPDHTQGHRRISRKEKREAQERAQAEAALKSNGEKS